MYAAGGAGRRWRLHWEREHSSCFWESRCGNISHMSFMKPRAFARPRLSGSRRRSQKAPACASLFVCVGGAMAAETSWPTDACIIRKRRVSSVTLPKQVQEDVSQIQSRCQACVIVGAADEDAGWASTSGGSKRRHVDSRDVHVLGQKVSSLARWPRSCFSAAISKSRA